MAPRRDEPPVAANGRSYRSCVDLLQMRLLGDEPFIAANGGSYGSCVDSLQMRLLSVPAA